MAQPSSSSAAAYPPSATGSAPGVLTTSAGVPGTVSSTCSRPEVRTGTAGNARPSSSAVRRAPTTCARSRNPPHSEQCQPVSSRPHHAHHGAPASRASKGPAQCRHRAGSRHRAQASRGTYPRRGTCTSTGPCFSPSRTACQARVGSRAARAASSRARSPSPTVRTSGAADRTCSRPATNGRAHPLSTSCAASTVQLQLPSRNAHLSCAARSNSTSRACGCGACNSLWLSSPSSQSATSPRSRTGANMAARVPITARTAPAARRPTPGTASRVLRRR